MTMQQKLTNAETVIREAKVLRDLQKQYFKTRDLQVLNQCKIQEKKVDLLIEDYTSPPTLFS